MASQQNNSVPDVASRVAIKQEYDAETDDEEVASAANKKAKRDDNEHEKYIKKIREITDQLLALGRHDGSTLKQVHRIARDLASFSRELSSSVTNSISQNDSVTDVASRVAIKQEYDADTDEEAVVSAAANKKTKRDDNEHEKYIEKIREITDQLLALSRHDEVRRIADDLRLFSWQMKEKLEKQRAIEESWKDFERENGLMVWARYSDNPTAQQHLAYLCSGHNGPDDGDHVWIRWENDIGKRVRVAKSIIENLEYTYSKMYAFDAWSEGSKLFMLPYDRFLFWRNLSECKTWGDIRAMCNDEFINMLKDRYERRWNRVEEDHEKRIKNLTDDTVINVRGEKSWIKGDFDKPGLAVFDCIPPMIERLMRDELYVEHKWIRKYGQVEDDIYEINIDRQEAIFEDMEKRGLVAIYCPQMSDILPSYGL